MYIYILLIIFAVLSLSCANVDAVRSEDSASLITPSPTQAPKVPLNQINLALIGPTGGKGRVQDRDYIKLQIVDQLLHHGKEAIPFLIDKLDDETKIDYQIVDFWNDAYVGDVAFMILQDFFLDSKWEKSAIEGMDWDSFLERGNNRDITGEGLLRRYIEKYGRKKIKQRWQDAWDKSKDRIYWNDQERNFKLRVE